MDNKQDQALQDQAPADDQAQAQQAQDQIAEQIKKLQTEIAGLNRKNNDLAKKLKDAELDKLTEDERVKAELADARKEKEQVELEARQFRRQLTIEKSIRKYNLPESFSSRIQGSSDEEIEADAKSIADFLSGEITRRATEDVKVKLSGKPPVGGTTPDVSGFQGQYDAAKKANDAALMIAIQRRAGEAGERIRQF